MNAPRFERLSCRDRMDLVRDWSTWLYEHTETFEGDLAIDLAYLWPAIVQGTVIEVRSTATLLALIHRRGRDRDDPIFQFIRVVDDAAGDPPLVAALRRIARDREAQRLDPATGRRSRRRDAILIDPSAADAVLEVYDRVTPEQRRRLAALPITRLVADAFQILAAAHDEVARRGTECIARDGAGLAEPAPAAAAEGA